MKEIQVHKAMPNQSPFPTRHRGPALTPINGILANGPVKLPGTQIPSLCEQSARKVAPPPTTPAPVATVTSVLSAAPVVSSSPEINPVATRPANTISELPQVIPNPLLCSSTTNDVGKLPNFDAYFNKENMPSLSNLNETPMITLPPVTTLLSGNHSAFVC